MRLSFRVDETVIIALWRLFREENVGDRSRLITVHECRLAESLKPVAAFLCFLLDVREEKHRTYFTFLQLTEIITANRCN